MHRWTIGLIACAIACSGEAGFGSGPLPDDVQAVLDFDGHAVVGADDAIGDYRGVVAAARAIDPEVIAAQPFDIFEVIASNGDRTASVVLKGIPTDGTVTDYTRYLVEGRAVRPSPSAGDELEVVMGNELARRLHVRVADTLAIVMPIVDPTDAKQPRSTRARVVGIMHAPMIEYGDRMMITGLLEMQRFGDAGDVVTGVELRLQHREAAPRVAQALETKLGAGYQVMDWCELHKRLWKAMRRRCP